MKQFCFIFAFLLVVTNFAFPKSLNMLNMISQKGKITKSTNKDHVGKKFIFFNLFSDKPEIYKETINMKTVYIKSNEDESCIILLDEPILHARYVNYIIINKHKNTFMYVESQIWWDKDFANTISYGELTD